MTLDNTFKKAWARQRLKRRQLAVSRKVRRSVRVHWKTASGNLPFAVTEVPRNASGRVNRVKPTLSLLGDSISQRFVSQSFSY